MQATTQHRLLQQAALLQQQAMLSSFPLLHEDYVLDLAFDFYGRRIATCSADQKIRIWEKKQKSTAISHASGPAHNAQSSVMSEGQDGLQGQQPVFQWELVEELFKKSGHQAAVLRVQWADPEFGSVIASASYDKIVHIWEEVEVKDKKEWQRKNMFQENDAITDIKFAPKHWGLMLAIVEAVGIVNIHIAKDLNNLTQWQEVHKVETNSLGCTCLSWNPAFDEPQMFIVGCNASGKSVQAQENQAQENEDSLLQIYYKKTNQSNFTLYSNKFHNGHKMTINDVAWAPLVGRSFHMVASCSQDALIVWKVVVRDIFSQDQGIYKEPIIEPLMKEQTGIPGMIGQVWRLAWNILGTCLAGSSGEDGCVRIWKKGVTKSFSQIAEIKAR